MDLKQKVHLHSAAWYLQTGEQLGELGEERQENKPDEVGLRGRFGHFVSVHERGHWKPFEFLCVALHSTTNKEGKFIINEDFSLITIRKLFPSCLV